MAKASRWLVLLVRLLRIEAACKDQACPADRWWEAELNFRSPHVMRVDTLNFNSTVTHFRNQSLLVAFYDPRSESFRELRPAIEAAAEAAAKASLGVFGAVDVTVHSFLALREAPEVQMGWQENSKGAFRFGRPRYYPLIIIYYRDGMRQTEYKGALKKKQLVDFLKRRTEPQGAMQRTAEDLRNLFRRPGPYVLACGLEAEAAAQAANGKEMIFATAPADLCVALANVSSPSLLYIRMAATQLPWPVRAQVQSSLEVLRDKDRLSAWLSLQRPVVLEEITPDNSWQFLDRPAPLVIFLVDGKDPLARAAGEALFGEVEAELEAKYFQLTWADCGEFKDQLGVKECPAVVVVDTETMQPKHLRLEALLKETEVHPEHGHWVSAADRLRWWLEQQTVEARKLIDDEGESVEPLPEPKEPLLDPKDPDVEEVAWEPSWPMAVLQMLKKRKVKITEEGSRFHVVDVVGETVDLKKNETQEALQDASRFPLQIHFQAQQVDDAEADNSENFLHEWAAFPEDASGWEGYNIFQACLQHMVNLRQSFKERYGDRLSFDFSDLDRAQQLHPHMSLLAQHVEEVQEVLGSTAARRALWSRMEQRLSFLDGLEGQETRKKVSRRAKFHVALKKGVEALAVLFRNLFSMLHGQARDGAIGEPAPVREVPRRAADTLSLKEFIESYAKPGLPVILTGLNLTAQDWTLDFFRERCNVSVSLMRRNPKAESWGRLEKVARLPLTEFLDSFTKNATRRKWYLHDWSLPRYCPQAFGPPPYRGFTVPKYFVGDYFQRAAFEGYQHTWPSLFVGSNETQSSMHIDSGSTNFMMHLLSGRKEWRFYSVRDLINLYQSPVGSHFHFDVFRPDHDKFPLARFAEQWRGLQEPGETIVIPAGNPHAVRNLEHIHGLSMNYVDASNWKMSILQRIWELQAHEVELYTDGVSMSHGLASDQEPLAFGEWKAQDWKKAKYDLF